MRNWTLLLLVALFSSIASASQNKGSLLTLSAKDIQKVCSELIETLHADIDKITNDKQPPNFQNTVVELEFAINEFHASHSQVSLPSVMAPEKSVRDAAEKCSIEGDQALLDVFAKQDLFNRFYVIKSARSYKKLKGVDKGLFDLLYKRFISNGFEIKDLSKRTRVVTLNKEVTELSKKFRKNIREIKGEVWVSKQELEGVDASVVEGLETKDGTYKLTTDYPVFFPVIDHAKNEQTRKKILTIFYQRGGKENINILHQVLQKREQVAHLLGYKNFAEAKFEIKGFMAQTPKEARSFLDKLLSDLKKPYKKEIEQLKVLKCKETKCKDPKKVEIYAWDKGYYKKQVEKSIGDLDQNTIKEYFPLPTVTKGMFEIYESLFNLKITKVPNKDVWFDTVEYYHVFDAQSNALLAEFYLDMFPRKGKYEHAGVVSVVRARINRDGSRRMPLSVMLCNFSLPTKQKPSLLSHDEVETYFHEFGHLIHNSISNARYASQAGTSVPRDFVEAPSQMLENWVWKKESLQKLSGHYKTGASLPDDDLEMMLKLKHLNQATHYMGQATIASIDLDLHTLKQPFHAQDVWDKRYQDHLLSDPVENTARVGTFGHLMGYESVYYGYLWSLVYAQDMFSEFEKKGFMNPSVGMRYREIILEPGGSIDTNKLLKQFLGRKPNNKAFLRDIGL